MEKADLKDLEKFIESQGVIYAEKSSYEKKAKYRLFVKLNGDFEVNEHHFYGPKLRRNHYIGPDKNTAVQVYNAIGI